MIGRVKRLELRSIWKSEASGFTTWLEQNLDALSEVVGFDMTVVKREHQVGPFSADLLAVDEYGQKVIIENQLEKTDHSHLGQILTYYCNTDAKICIWIAKEPRPEHMIVVNWLNMHTSLNFYLVQIEAISIGPSQPAALFQIACKPDEASKQAVAQSSSLSEREQFNIEFWTDINAKCADRLPGFCSRRPLKYHFHAQATGRGGLSLTFLAASKYYGIELYIDTQDADLNDSLLRQLESQKTKIEKIFGHTLVFDPIPDKRACRIRYVIGHGDVMDLDRNQIQNELIDHMIALEKAVKPLIKDLDFDSESAA